MRHKQTPISASAQIALEVLRPRIDDADCGLPRAKAEEAIAAEDSSLSDASSVVTELLQKGYLYRVNGNLRIP